MVGQLRLRGRLHPIAPESRGFCYGLDLGCPEAHVVKCVPQSDAVGRGGACRLWGLVGGLQVTGDMTSVGVVGP